MIITNKRNGKRYDVEIKKSFMELTKGLSGKKSIPKDGGILMDFKWKMRHGIWMLGMRFAIDIIFIDDEKKVESVNTAEPMTLNPKTWKVYYPSKAVRYVLELNTNSGFSKGDILEWKNSKKQLKKSKKRNL